MTVDVNEQEYVFEEEYTHFAEYWLGYEAHRNSSNPFSKDTPEYKAWNIGFVDRGYKKLHDEKKDEKRELLEIERDIKWCRTRTSFLVLCSFVVVCLPLIVWIIER